MAEQKPLEAAETADAETAEEPKTGALVKLQRFFGVADGADAKEGLPEDDAFEPGDAAKKRDSKRAADFRELNGRRILQGSLKTPRATWKILSLIRSGMSADVLDVYWEDAPAPQPRPDDEEKGPKERPADLANNLTFALKVARRGAKGAHSTALLNELKALCAIHHSQEASACFPKLLDYGMLDESDGFRNFVKSRLERDKRTGIVPSSFPPLAPVPFMVMERLSLSLDEFVSSSPLRRLGRHMAMALGVGCLKALTALHDLGLIHRHVTPRNFMLRLPAGSRADMDDPVHLEVVLIDFGAVEPWPSRPDARRDFDGSVKYASPNLHQYKWPGPVDDLWSLQYMVTEWLTAPRPLPWGACKHVNGQGGAGPLKLAAKPADLYRGCPPQLLKAHDILKELSCLHAAPKDLTSLYEDAFTSLRCVKPPSWLPFCMADPNAH